jgi:hypothetical protein
VSVVRDLEWEGSFNVRDLGGLPTSARAPTRRRSIIRADALDRLTETGWRQAVAYGVRTVVDLRNEDERARPLAARPAAVAQVRAPLEPEDRDFHAAYGGPLRATPLSYAPLLERHPERVARVVRAIAHAPPGGVVVHCGIGRDRAGLVTLVLLALVGVPADEIVRDHAISTQRLAALFAHEGRADEAPIVERLLAERGTTVEQVLRSVLDRVDVAARLRAGGLRDDEVEAVRARLAG